MRGGDVRGDDGTRLTGLCGHARMAEWNEPAARAEGKRSAGVGTSRTERGYEGRLDHGDRPVQHRGVGRGPTLQPVPGLRSRICAFSVSRVVCSVETHRAWR